MKSARSRIFCLVIPTVAWGLLSSLNSSAQELPQDNWYFMNSMGSSGSSTGQFLFATGITISPSNEVFITDSTRKKVLVFDTESNFIREWGVAGFGPGEFGTPREISISTNGNVYIVDSAHDKVLVFDYQGSFLFDWGPGNSGILNLTNPRGIALSTNNEIYVTDNGNHRIVVYDANGTFIREWGAAGTVPGNTTDPTGITAGPNGHIYVCGQNGGTVKKYTPNGDYIRTITDGGGGQALGVYVAEDGLIYVCDFDGSNGGVPIYSDENTSVGTLRESDYKITEGLQPSDCVVGKDFRLYVAAINSTWGSVPLVFGRGYRTMINDPLNHPPAASVINSQQRQGTSLIDVDYAVYDENDSTVSVGALGFTVQFNVTLNEVVKMTDFVEGTSANLGDGIPVVTPHRITWNAATDISTNFANIYVSILANDGRPPLDFHYIKIQSNDLHSAITINRSPITQSDLQSVWMWLIATNDASIIFSTGSVVAVGGTYNGQLLAQGSTTTESGRDFIFERLNIRVATTQEVQYAKEASSPGTINQFDPRNRIGDIPKKVNEWGFDTGSYATNDWWVVPLP